MGELELCRWWHLLENIKELWKETRCGGQINSKINFGTFAAFVSIDRLCFWWLCMYLLSAYMTAYASEYCTCWYMSSVCMHACTCVWWLRICLLSACMICICARWPAYMSAVWMSLCACLWMGLMTAHVPADCVHVCVCVCSLHVCPRMCLMATYVFPHVSAACRMVFQYVGGLNCCLRMCHCRHLRIVCRACFCGLRCCECVWMESVVCQTCLEGVVGDGD